MKRRKEVKSIKSVIAGIVLAFAIILLPQGVFAAETVPVTTVEDITDLQGVSSTNIQVGTGDYSNTVQFTLSKPAYVNVTAYSTVMYEGWTALGNIHSFAVYSDANCSNLVLGDSSRGIYGNDQATKYLCLDAGTYYVYFAKGVGDEYSAESSGEFRLTVAAQYLNVTGTRNGSWARAKSVSTDKSVTGFLSSNTRTSWFKFKVDANTAVKLTASIENPLQDKFELNPTGVTIYRSNHKIMERLNITDSYYETASSNTLTLSKGTYYIGITGDSSYSPWDDKKLETNEKHNMGVVNLKLTTIKKVTISSLKNVKGKKAQVTYKAVSGAKGYEIQYSTKSNFKSGVKTVKAGASKKTVTISKLTKNKKYYVRVRAWKYDAEGEKVYGTWSNAKNVKITK